MSHDLVDIFLRKSCEFIDHKNVVFLHLFRLFLDSKDCECTFPILALLIVFCLDHY